jgi:hypothetical protein
MLTIVLIISVCALLLALYAFRLVYKQDQVIEDLAISATNMLTTCNELVKLYESLSQSQQLHTKGFAILAETQRETTKDLNGLRDQVSERISYCGRTYNW